MYAHVCVCVCVCVNMYNTMISKNVSTLTCLVPPNHLPSPQSTSTPMKTPDPQPSYLSASLKETVHTPKDRQGLMMALNHDTCF